MVGKTPVTTKKIKYLGVNVTRSVQKLFEKNFKRLLKDKTRFEPVKRQFSPNL